MRSFLISDNKDTWVGMQLAGIDGAIVHTADEALQALKNALKNEDIGLVIMTEKAVDQVREEFMELKLKCKTPLLIEIPDRHGSSRPNNMITNYVRDSVGINL